MKNSTVEPVAVESQDKPGNDLKPLTESFEDEESGHVALDEDQSLRAKEEQIASLQADLDEKEELVKRYQEQNAHSEEQLDALRKELRQSQHDKSLLQSDNDTLKHEVQTADLDKRDAQKKLTTKEQELGTLQKKLREVESQVRDLAAARKKLAAAKEQDVEAEEKVEKLVQRIDKAGVEIGLAMGSLPSTNTPGLMRYYFGPSPVKKMKQFMQNKPIPLHLDVDFLRIAPSFFPFTTEARIVASRLTGEVRTLCNLKQTISGPGIERWECKLGGLAEGIYQMEGYISCANKGKPLFAPILIDLGRLIII